MPIYDYQCDQCETTFEIQASFHDKELGLEPVCPKCQGKKTHQVLTAGLFITSSSPGNASSSSCCDPNAGSGCCG